jgi:hypothetical protein
LVARSEELATLRYAQDQYGIGGRLLGGAYRRREAAMTRNDLRRKNDRLREQIAQAVEKDPELRDRDEGIALRQDLHVQVGTPFLERTQGKLQERAGAIVERRPELEHHFED